MKQSRLELVFIPFPIVSHLTSALTTAKLMTRRDPRLSVTIFILEIPFGSIDPHQYTASDSIRFVTLPAAELSLGSSSGPDPFFSEHIKAYMPLVRDAVRHLVLTRSEDGDDDDLVRLAGFVLDMFCTHMIDLAHEFDVPSYLLFSSGAAFLGFLLHVQFLHDHHGLTLDEFKDSDTELEVPSFANPVPGKVFPYLMFNKSGAETLLYHTRRFRQVKGILVNTFLELESYAAHSIESTSRVLPTVYLVGPILNVGPDKAPRDAGATMSWLDDQPPSSVIFLCFGSMGAFSEDQIKEIARGLERSGHRFLWSLRRSAPTGVIQPPTDYENMEDALPVGFLDRTAEIGKVIGWAPQAAILAHPAVGGFVSHCGWNSALESIWHGVPIATWPLYAEQQLNAFQMVQEMGLGVEIKIDYVMHRDRDCVVSGEEIEIGVKKVMGMESDVRKKTKEMKEKSRQAMIEGGSSYLSLGCFIDDMMVVLSNNPSNRTRKEKYNNTHTIC